MYFIVPALLGSRGKRVEDGAVYQSYENTLNLIPTFVGGKVWGGKELRLGTVRIEQKK